MATFEELYHTDNDGNLRNQTEVDRARENGDLVECNGKLYDKDNNAYDYKGYKY